MFKEMLLSLAAALARALSGLAGFVFVARPLARPARRWSRSERTPSLFTSS